MVIWFLDKNCWTRKAVLGRCIVMEQKSANILSCVGSLSHTFMHSAQFVEFVNKELGKNADLPSFKENQIFCEQSHSQSKK